MIQVGQHKPGTKRPYSYGDVFFDADGWADVKRYLPVSYELVLMKDENDKTIIGWHSGGSWDGLKYKAQEIKLWKRKMDGET